MLTVKGIEMFRASQASDVGSIPIARSITYDDSIVLTPLNQLNTATKLGVLVPNVPQPEVGSRWPPPSIGSCLGVDHPESIFFELRPGKWVKKHPSSRCRRHRTHILASV